MPCAFFCFGYYYFKNSLFWKKNVSTWINSFIWPIFDHPGQKFLSHEKSRAFYEFSGYPPPFNFFGGRPRKIILFFLFKVSTYVFDIGIIFLHTLLQILIWGKKVLTLCQKMHFFWQNNTFSFRNCKKKRFRLRFLKTMHILFLFTSLGQLRQHRSYFVHF